MLMYSDAGMQQLGVTIVHNNYNVAFFTWKLSYPQTQDADTKLELLSIIEILKVIEISYVTSIWV